MKTSWFKSLAAAAVAAVTFGFAPSAQAVSVEYRYATYNTEGDPKSGIKEWKTATADATPITTQTSLSAGWYVVNADKTISSRITCSGNVHLILADGFTLKASAGITVNEKESAVLTIYGQVGNTGALIATGGEYYAGIGGIPDVMVVKKRRLGAVTIHGGTVTATGGKYAAGIGGGYHGQTGGGYGKNITINGGTVTATGSYGAAGIGGSNLANGGNTVLNGGKIIASSSGSEPGCGIGDGDGIFMYGEGIYAAEDVEVFTRKSTSDVWTKIDHDSTTDLMGKSAFRRAYVRVNCDNKVHVAECDHGTVTTSAGSAIEGDSVTLTVTPEEGYALATLSVAGATTTPELTTVEEGKTYTFTMPGEAVTVTATFKSTIVLVEVKPVAAENTTLGGVFTNHIAVVESGTPGSYAVVSNATVDVVFNADSGYAFDDYSTVKTNTVEATESVNVVAGPVAKLTEPIPSAPTTVANTTHKVYTNGVESAGDTVWSNLMATVVYTAADGYYFEDGLTVSTNELDTTVNPAVNKTVPKAPIRGFPIMVAQSPGGTVSADRAVAETGQLIALTITPDSGYAYASENVQVYKTGDPGTAVTVKDNAFVMPAYPVTVTVTFTQGVGYRYAVYNDPSDPASGIAEWKWGVCTTYNTVGTGTSWSDSSNDGWYVLTANQTVDGRITCTGNIKLILMDGCKLTTSSTSATSNRGITVVDGTATLTIYGQEAGTGEIEAKTAVSRYAGIGGANTSAAASSGAITIHGGMVTASGGVNSAGIGGGYTNGYGTGANITINGGTVTAVASNTTDPTAATGAGIGGSTFSAGHHIVINGGKVMADGGEGAGAGIGGGKYGDGHDITINGGTVTALGGRLNEVKALGGAAIGGGGSGVESVTAGVGSNIRINGGTVYAAAMDHAEVIGNGGGSATASSGNAVSPDARMFFNVAGQSVAMPTSFENDTIMTPETAITRTLVGGVDAWTAAGTFDLLNGATAETGAITVNASESVAFANVNLKLAYADDKLELRVVAPSVPYLEAIYNMPGVPTSGIASWSVKKCETYTVIDPTTTGWTEGWYVVTNTVTISDRISCAGNVHLILADGAVLTASAGIAVPSTRSLTIYGQEEGTGVLNAQVDSQTASMAGIGGGNGENLQNSGPITIHGGVVTAKGGANAAGIGGGRYGTSGTSASNYGTGNNITINGGTVTATGGENAAGIGGSYGKTGSDITLNGGTITATSGNASAWGIGYGYKTSGYSSLGIFADTNLTVSASANNSTWEEIAHDRSTDLSTVSNFRKRYVKTVAPTTFVITIADCEHGSVTGSASKAMPDETVTLTVTPEEGYVLDTLSVVGATTTPELTTVEEGKTYTFTMPAEAVTVTATFKLSVELVEVKPVAETGATVWNVYTNGAEVAYVGNKYMVASNATVDVEFYALAQGGYFFKNGTDYSSYATNTVTASENPTYVANPTTPIQGTSCGGATYAFVDSGKMTIVGTGATSSWPSGIGLKSVTSVVINPGITGIGEAFFRGCTKLKTVTGGRDLATVGNKAFTKCFSLETILLDCKKPQGLEDAVVYQTAVNPDGTTYQIPSISVKDYVNRLFGSKSVENPEWVDLGSPENKSMYETEYNFFQIRMVPVE